MANKKRKFDRNRIAEFIEMATTRETTWGPYCEASFNEYKFAEIIINECINEIHNADVGDLIGKSYYLDKVAEHIEAHFGLKK